MDAVVEAEELPVRVTVDVTVVLGVVKRQLAKIPLSMSSIVSLNSDTIPQLGLTFMYPSMVQLALPDAGAGNAWRASAMFSVVRPALHVA